MAVELLAQHSGSSHGKCSLCSFHFFGKILHNILYLGKHKRNRVVQETSTTYSLTGSFLHMQYCHKSNLFKDMSFTTDSYNQGPRTSNASHARTH